jgi:hypothetical protein
MLPITKVGMSYGWQGVTDAVERMWEDVGGCWKMLGVVVCRFTYLLCPRGI